MKTNIDPNGLSEELMCKLIKSQLIDRKKAQHILLARSAHLKKETVACLTEYCSLPGNNLTSLEIAVTLEDNKVLNNLVRSITKQSKYLDILLRDVLQEKWVSAENIALILSTTGTSFYWQLDKIVEAQSKISFNERLVDIAVEVCRSSRMEVHTRMYLWNSVRRNLQKQSDIVFPHSFYEAGRKVVAEIYKNNPSDSGRWLLGAIETYSFDLVLKTKSWKEANQDLREAWVRATDVPWNHLANAKNGLGFIKWQEMTRSQRCLWIETQSAKVPKHEGERFSWSLFMFEIDALKRKKSFTEKSLKPLMEFIDDNDGINGLVYYMQFAGEGKKLFNELPHEKQFELVFKAPLPQKVARVFVNYCTLTFKEWLKLWQKFNDIPNELIISNTDWNLESTAMIKKASELF